jgi:hypothetical protein
MSPKNDAENGLCLAIDRLREVENYPADRLSLMVARGVTNLSVFQVNILTEIAEWIIGEGQKRAENSK